MDLFIKGEPCSCFSKLSYRLVDKNHVPVLVSIVLPVSNWEQTCLLKVLPVPVLVSNILPVSNWEQC